MIKILFICHGNICRSPMAEFVCKDLLKKQGLSHKVLVSSAATSSEEIGNPVHYGTKKKLQEIGISCDGKYAVQAKKTDYNHYDYIIGMDNWNLKNMKRIFGGDPDKKLYLLLDFSSQKGEISDPWYTGDFERTYQDVLSGCLGLIAFIKQQHSL